MVFDSNILKIEKEIVNYLIKSPLFLGQEPKKVLIIALFITRKRLTQRILKHLTGYYAEKPFSSGSISMELNALVEQNIIRKAQTSSSGEITYEIESMEAVLMNSNLQTLKELTTVFGDKLKIIKKGMEEERKEIKFIHGFWAVYRIVSLFYNTIDFSNKIIEILEDELNARENKSS